MSWLKFGRGRKSKRQCYESAAKILRWLPLNGNTTGSIVKWCFKGNNFQQNASSKMRCQKTSSEVYDTKFETTCVASSTCFEYLTAYQKEAKIERYCCTNIHKLCSKLKILNSMNFSKKDRVQFVVFLEFFRSIPQLSEKFNSSLIDY